MLNHEWYGDEGSPVLVLSSGLGGLGAYWEPNVLALAEDYRVLTYDHRGTGGSAADVEAPQTIEAMADDVAALLDALGVEEPVGFVGHALGGLIGLQLAMTQPDRVARLIVVNGWASMDAHTARCFRVREAMLRLDPALYGEAAPLFLYPPAWISEHDVELAAAHGAPTASVTTMLARIEGLRGWHPGGYRLGALATPTLCLGVDDDFLVPAACSQALASALGKGTHASFANGGHAVNVTRPQEFTMRVQDWFH